MRSEADDGLVLGLGRHAMLVAVLRLILLLTVTIVVVGRDHGRMILKLKFALVKLVNLASTSTAHASLQVFNH